MVKVLFIILVVMALLISPLARYTIMHPIRVIKYLFKDGYYYFKHKKYNECHEFGKIRMNTAAGDQVFGCGKTLSLVRYARNVYNKYNGLQVWDKKHKAFCTQHIHIISNVNLYDVPYIPWESEKQFTELAQYGFPEQDITIFLLDEIGTIFNSRNFRDNISPEFLTKLLQSRKNKMCLYSTSQRFLFTDKILRESCSTVTTCKKFWRFITLSDYNAYDLENTNNPALLKPIRSYIWLAQDDDYNSYDTEQLIERLKKQNDDGDLLSTAEILQTRGDSVAGIDNISKKHFKRNRAQRKNR